MQLDKTDCNILNLLQKNCRVPLTHIAKEVHLSVDSVKKRINKMIENKVFYPKIQIRPRNLGFSNILEIQVKLHNYTKQELERFQKYLTSKQYIPELIQLSGEWDFLIVLLAKDGEDTVKKCQDIRDKFGKIINEWSESLTTIVHKFESYDMVKLMRALK